MPIPIRKRPRTTCIFCRGSGFCAPPYDFERQQYSDGVEVECRHCQPSLPKFESNEQNWVAIVAAMRAINIPECLISKGKKKYG